MSEEPHAVDVQVGSAIRIQRLIKRLSQTALADRIGVTFQQVQKYERGSNRVSASKLVEIADALEVDVCILFAEITRKSPSDTNESFDNNTDEGVIFSRDAVILNAAFSSIKDKSIRKKILELVLSVAETKKL